MNRDCVICILLSVEQLAVTAINYPSKSEVSTQCFDGYDGARDLAREIATTDAYVISMKRRKKVEMLFAHLKRIMKLDRLRLRGPNGAKDEFHLAATAQNLRKLAKLIPMPA